MDKVTYSSWTGHGRSYGQVTNTDKVTDSSRAAHGQSHGQVTDTVTDTDKVTDSSRRGHGQNHEQVTGTDKVTDSLRTGHGQSHGQVTDTDKVTDSSWTGHGQSHGQVQSHGQLTDMVTDILSYLRRHGIISKQQHGFLSGRSTTSNLLEIFNDWTFAFYEKTLLLLQIFISLKLSILFVTLNKNINCSRIRNIRLLT